MQANRRRQSGLKFIIPLKGSINNLALSMIYPVLGLLIIGVFNVFSATFVMDADTPFYRMFVVKQGVFALLSLGVAAAIYKKMNYRALKNLNSLFLVCGIMVLLFVLVAVVGVTINGARRWISLGGISFQPSELAKLIGIIWTAYWMGKCLDRKGFSWARILVAFAFPTIFALFTLRQPDMGTAVLLMFFPYCLICASGLPSKAIWGTLAVAIAGGVMLVLAAPYRMERIKSLWDPFAHAQDLGYQSVQGIIAIGSGGFTGQGIAQGTSKYLYLPEAHTDFAFAVWAQETGFLGSMLVLFLLLWFTWVGFSIAGRTKDSFGSLLAYGITLIISVQGLFNILMVCGSAPVTGVPLPFVSYGGSSLLMNMIAIGLLANIARYTRQDELKGLQERKSL